MRLQDGDLTVRQFLYVSKATPYLTELAKAIDLFEENILKGQKQEKQVPILQEGNETGKCNDLEAFTHVVGLLTGESLGYENYLDHHSKIEPIVRSDISEINNTTPFSCNQKKI